MKLTNQQVEDALNALMRFNPKCSYKVKMRLTRNLRRLKQAWEEKEHDRQVLMCEAVKDKTRRQENGQLALTAEECAEVARMTRELMKSEVDVDLHPVPLFDSTEHGEVPDGIDVVTVPIENVIWTALIDVVFSETTGQQAAQPAA